MGVRVMGWGRGGDGVGWVREVGAGVTGGRSDQKCCTSVKT